MATSIPPWQSTENVLFNLHLETPTKVSDSIEEKRKNTLETIEKLPSADIIMWTDGSVGNSVNNGGSGIIIQNRENEMNAMRGLEMLRSANLNKIKEIRKCSDSQSSINKLQGGPSLQDDTVGDTIWQHLIHLTSQLIHITFQWIPGHSDIEGNEKADVVAKEGTQKQQENCALEFKTVIAAVKREMKKKMDRNSW